MQDPDLNFADAFTYLTDPNPDPAVAAAYATGHALLSIATTLEGIETTLGHLVDVLVQIASER